MRTLRVDSIPGINTFIRFNIRFIRNQKIINTEKSRRYRRSYLNNGLEDLEDLEDPT